MQKLIKVLIINEDGQYGIETIENELSSFQDIVGGLIECVNIGNGIVAICDDEGRLKGKKPSALVDLVNGPTIDFVGTIAICHSNSDDFASITANDLIYLGNHLYLFDNSPDITQ